IIRSTASQGLEILAFPCNNFGGQEPGSNAEVCVTVNTTILYTSILYITLYITLYISLYIIIYILYYILLCTIHHMLFTTHYTYWLQRKGVCCSIGEGLLCI
ncbi:hypothetical protein B484DRAFT_341118, partial [Ochromonadaceae sp. CCMP2298]